MQTGREDRGPKDIRAGHPGEEDEEEVEEEEDLLGEEVDTRDPPGLIGQRHLQ